MTVLKYPNCSELEEEVEMAYVPKSIKISSVGRNFGKTNFDLTQLIFSNSRNSTKMEWTTSRSSASLSPGKLKWEKETSVWTCCRGCALSHWLEPPCIVEERGWIACHSSSLSGIRALGFWKCPLSDRRRSLLFLVRWGLSSPSYG